MPDLEHEEWLRNQNERKQRKKDGKIAAPDDSPVDDAPKAKADAEEDDYDDEEEQKYYLDDEN